MRKLARREQVLVYIAGVLCVLTACFQFLLLPASQSRRSARDELSILELREKENCSKAAALPLLKEELEKERNAVDERKKDYFFYEDKTKLIDIMTRQIERYGFAPRMLQITGEGLFSSDEEEGYEIYEAKLSVQMESAGNTPDGFASFLDWVSDALWINLSSCSAKDNVITMELSCYMIHITEV